MDNQNPKKTFKWLPAPGKEIEDFLNNCAPKESAHLLKESAISILSKSVCPRETKGDETGLIVGYVQSGKTMSFESVTALAKDNKIQLIIIVAGTSNPLLEQSSRRLQKDLGIMDAKRARRWVFLKNPDDSTPNVEQLRNTLSDWRDDEIPETLKKTIIITVLKHHGRLNNLAKLLAKIDLTGVSSIIIDDEADQVSLNAGVANDEESPTYNKLMNLKQSLPNHTYLQYTATPQAPLLINIIDSLSPNFVQVLEPGEAYIGGKDFFGDNYRLYCRTIPATEVPTKNNPLSEPPDSLIEALKIFMIGVTIGLDESNNTGNRSMLVHPSHLTLQHQEFCGWVRSIFNNWKMCLNSHDNDLDRINLLKEFKFAYDDLAKTIENIPPFSLIEKKIKLAFTNTQIVEVNAREGKTPDINWLQNYGWILIGGSALDRGFTIEGLTVTYMPRGIGVGNADTIQQRARFFGYKKGYLGYCRIYLEDSTLQAFRNYVEHEEDIRSQLINIQEKGKSLNSWKRAFVLDSTLKPCRDSVLQFDYLFKKFSDTWTHAKVVNQPEEIVSYNRQLINNFLKNYVFIPNPGHPERTDIQKHTVCNSVKLTDVLDKMLIDVKVTNSKDAQINIALLLQIKKIVEKNPEEECVIYKMSSGLSRSRTIALDGSVTELFQGAHPNKVAGENEIYSGDRLIRDKEKITIQVHNLTLKDGVNTIIKDVPVLAVFIPSKFAKTILVQEHN